MIVTVSMTMREMIFMKFMMKVTVSITLMGKRKIQMTTWLFHNTPKDHKLSTMHYHHNLGCSNN